MSTEITKSCPVCGDDSESAVNAMTEYELHVQYAGVCAACAERIANAFSMKHGGRWLTWANKEAPSRKSGKAVIGQRLRTQVFERDFYRCLRCGTHLNLRADHVVPESQGGEATLENLQTLCQPCNSWKGTKTIDFRLAEDRDAGDQS